MNLSITNGKEKNVNKQSKHDRLELDFVTNMCASSTTNAFESVHKNEIIRNKYLFTTSTPYGKKDFVYNLSPCRPRQLLPTTTTTKSAAVVEEAKQIWGKELHTKTNTLNPNTCVGVAAAAEQLDRRLIVLLFLFALIIIGYKMVIVAVPYVNTTNLQVLSEYAQTKLNEALIWSNERDWIAMLSPLICGLAMTIFSYAMVYLDSNIPGLDPPSPFSPKSKQFQHRRNSLDLNYMTAISTGVIVTILMYANLYA